MKYCLLDFDIFPTNANANDDDYCRIAVVYDRQSNGAAPAYADIFLATDNAGTTVANSHAPFNHDNQYRFKVLYDEAFYLPMTDAGGDLTSNSIPYTVGMKQMNLKRKIHLQNLPVQFTGDTAAIASFATGSLYLVTIARLTPVATFSYSCNGHTRVVFSDV